MSKEQLLEVKTVEDNISIQVISENLDNVIEFVKEEKLYIVTCIFNPESYQSRYRLYNEFADYISRCKNAELWTIELAIGDQEFAVTDENDHRHMQLRTDEVLWYKENLLNILIKNLPSDAKYIAWIDADVHFLNENWVHDTIETLKKYPFVQMFEKADDLGPDGNVISSEWGFIHRWLNNTATEKRRGRSGLAWAGTREALDNVGLLIDWGIVGSGDWFMAFALTDQLTEYSLKIKSGGYSDSSLMTWYNLCKEHINGKVGYVPGILQHHWHGKKSDRGYNWRWKILSENKFNPETDLDYHENGLLHIKADKPKLLEDIKYYFKSRNEDSEETK